MLEFEAVKPYNGGTAYYVAKLPWFDIYLYWVGDLSVDIVVYSKDGFEREHIGNATTFGGAKGIANRFYIDYLEQKAFEESLSVNTPLKEAVDKVVESTNDFFRRLVKSFETITPEDFKRLESIIEEYTKDGVETEEPTFKIIQKGDSMEPTAKQPMYGILYEGDYHGNITLEDKRFYTAEEAFSSLYGKQVLSNYHIIKFVTMEVKEQQNG